eukprot:Awhi_evm1s3504
MPVENERTDPFETKETQEKRKHTKRHSIGKIADTQLIHKVRDAKGKIEVLSANNSFKKSKRQEEIVLETNNKDNSKSKRKSWSSSTTQDSDSEIDHPSRPQVSTNALLPIASTSLALLLKTEPTTAVTIPPSNELFIESGGFQNRTGGSLIKKKSLHLRSYLNGSMVKKKVTSTSTSPEGNGNMTSFVPVHYIDDCDKKQEDIQLLQQQFPSRRLSKEEFMATVVTDCNQEKRKITKSKSYSFDFPKIAPNSTYKFPVETQASKSCRQNSQISDVELILKGNDESNERESGNVSKFRNNSYNNSITNHIYLLDHVKKNTEKRRSHGRDTSITNHIHLFNHFKNSNHISKFNGNDNVIGNPNRNENNALSGNNDIETLSDNNNHSDNNSRNINDNYKFNNNDNNNHNDNNSSNNYSNNNSNNSNNSNNNNINDNINDNIYYVKDDYNNENFNCECNACVQNCIHSHKNNLDKKENNTYNKEKSADACDKEVYAGNYNDGTIFGNAIEPKNDKSKDENSCQDNTGDIASPVFVTNDTNISVLSDCYNQCDTEGMVKEHKKSSSKIRFNLMNLVTSPSTTTSSSSVPSSPKLNIDKEPQFLPNLHKLHQQVQNHQQKQLLKQEQKQHMKNQLKQEQKQNEDEDHQKQHYKSQWKQHLKQEQQKQEELELSTHPLKEKNITLEMFLQQNQLDDFDNPPPKP